MGSHSKSKMQNYGSLEKEESSKPATLTQLYFIHQLFGQVKLSTNLETKSESKEFLNT